MEHIQQLTMTWLRPQEARTEPREEPAPPELPDRERVRKLAVLYHRQLLQVRSRGENHYDLLRAQTEALRQFTAKLTPSQADVFMNMYTEESSAVEREWLARQRAQSMPQPLNPALVASLTFIVTLAAIGLAIYYAI